MPVVTLITDFGMRDYYVAAMKGVILGIADDVHIVDVTHDVEPQNIRHGAFVLWQIWSAYRQGTIHLAVVDPGVGSGRQIVVGRYAGRYVVAPDNGLLTFVHEEFPLEAMHVVENRRYFAAQVSATFHGRDIMAPVAAHLAKGVEAREFGPRTDLWEKLAVPLRAESARGCLRGSVLYVDRFGTMVTNIREEQLVGRRPHGGEGRAEEVLVNGVQIGPVRLTFCDVPVGEPLAFIGSCGLLEIAVNQGSAVERFGPADAVRVEVR